MGIVEHERHVGERHQAERDHDDAGGVAEGQQPPEARLQGQPQAEHEQREDGDEPADQPQRVDDVEAVHVS